MNRNVIWGLLCVQVCACSSINLDPPKTNADLVWQSQDERPAWTLLQTSEYGAGRFFVGLSDYYSSERVSKEAAYLDAATNASKYFIQTAAEESSTFTNGHSAVSDYQDPDLIFSQRKSIETQFSLSKLTPSDLYLEQYEGDDGKLYFKAYVRLYLSEEDLRASEKRAKVILQKTLPSES